MKAIGLTLIALATALIVYGIFFTGNTVVPICMGGLLLASGLLLRTEKSRSSADSGESPQEALSQRDSSPPTEMPARRRTTGVAFLRFLVGAAAMCVIVFTWVFFADRHAKNREEEQRTAAANELSRLIARQAALEETWLRAAIRDKRVILGMTRYEVEMARGKPYLRQRGQTQREEMLQLGSVETWTYDLGDGKVVAVLFGLNGQVIYSTDVKGLPREGNAVRQ